MIMSVEFSVSRVDLVNLYDDERAELKQKYTYYVQNRCSSSRKVRVALSKNSHPVSIDYNRTMDMDRLKVHIHWSCGHFKRVCLCMCRSFLC